MTRDITHVWIGSHRTGVIGLKQTFSEVRALNLADHEIIKDEIIRRARKSNYIAEEVESDYRHAMFLEYRRFLGEKIEEERGVMEIRVFGTGCMRCEELMRRIMGVAAGLKLPADVQHIRDLTRIAELGPVSTPVLVINGKVKTAGRVPSIKELESILS